MSSPSEITAPVTKAVTALGASAGASAMSVAQQAESFLPRDANGWMAFVASGVALLYTLHLLADFYWKKVWRPLFERRGWIKPIHRAWHGPRLDEGDSE